MFTLTFKTSNAAHRDPDGELDLQQVAYTVSEDLDDDEEDED